VKKNGLAELFIDFKKMPELRGISRLFNQLLFLMKPNTVLCFSR